MMWLPLWRTGRKPSRLSALATFLQEQNRATSDDYFDYRLRVLRVFFLDVFHDERDDPAILSLSSGMLLACVKAFGSSLHRPT